VSVRLSHADLLRAFESLPTAACDYAASLCGFAPREPDRPTVKQTVPEEPSRHDVSSRSKTRARAPRKRSTKHGTLRIMTPEAVEFRDSAEKASQNWLLKTVPISAAEWRVPKNPPPAPRKPDLMPWSRLWPYLHRAQSRLRAGPKPAVGRLVAALARLAPLRSIPYEPVWRWTQDSWILFDDRYALFPFQDDMRLLLTRWRTLFGSDACHAIFCREGKPPAKQPPPYTPVLYIGDFGMLDNRSRKLTHEAGDRETARLWRDYGRMLQRRGCTTRALVPCPRQRWDHELASVWACAYWSEAAPVPPPDRGWTALEPDEESSTQALELMTAMAAPALRIEMSLLRAMRRLLPRELDTPGVEYDFFHACSRNLEAVYLSPEAAETARTGFQRLPKKTQQSIADLLRRYHEDCAGVVRARETLLLSACGAPVEDEEVKRAKGLVGSVSAALFNHLRANDIESIILDGFANWLQCELESFTDFTAEEIAVAWKLVQWAIGNFTGPRPDSIANQDLLWLESLMKETPAQETTWQLHRTGAHFRIDLAKTEKVESSKECHGGLVARMPARNPKLEIVRTTADGRITHDMDLSRNLLLRNEDDDNTMEVRTDWAILKCKALAPPPWTTRFGWDRFGMFADFEVGGVTFVLRWIPPGEFLMGSPEDEPGRREWEGPQHRVTISRGFWLGKTPVTQGQYAAVTGESPSHFRNAGDSAPVEQVSWEDCQEFCRALRKGVADLDSGLSFRLPTEAEWEYAGRAATTTAIYTGPLTIRGENDGPELDAIAWYGGNSGVDYEGGHDSSGWPKKQHEHTRAGTHPVGQKDSNPWGLFDMLGNVWEWCEDVWHDSYEGAPTDGSARGGKGPPRVNRGGGWASFARPCRCAFRDDWEPGRRDRYAGFRLVLAARNKGDSGPFS